jgi:hypothetical protein
MLPSIRLNSGAAKMLHFLKGIANLAPIGAVIVFAIGLCQYSRAERWKRTEFVAKLFKEFSDDPNCEVAMCLLAGEKRKIFMRLGANGRNTNTITMSYAQR